MRERVSDFKEPGLLFVLHFNPPYDKAPLGCFVPVSDAADCRASKDEKPKGALRGSTLFRPPCTVLRAGEALFIVLSYVERPSVPTERCRAAVLRAAAREWFSAVRGRSPLTPGPCPGRPLFVRSSSPTLLRRSLSKSIQINCIGCQ